MDTTRVKNNGANNRLYWQSFVVSLIISLIVSPICVVWSFQVTNQIELGDNLNYELENTVETATTDKNLNWQNEWLSSNNDNHNDDTRNKPDEETMLIESINADRLSESDWKIYDQLCANEIDIQAEGQDTDLKQVLLVHRHGDRTPTMLPPADPLAKDPLWHFHGIGQLTNRGKQRMFVLGHLIRKRYNKFLSGQVSKRVRKTRSSAVPRCLDSAELFLASFLALQTTTTTTSVINSTKNSPDANLLDWARLTPEPNYDSSGSVAKCSNGTNFLCNLSLGAEWQPANIATLDKYDGLLKPGPCKNLAIESKARFESPEAQAINKKYEHEANVVQQLIGLKKTPKQLYQASSLLAIERSYMEHRMQPELLDVYDRIIAAGNGLFANMQDSHLFRRLRAGMLVHDINDNMKVMRKFTKQQQAAQTSNGDGQASLVEAEDDEIDDLVSESDARKFVHYSTHDTTTIALLGALNSVDKYPFRPHFSSSIVIELHHDEFADEWYVRLFYLVHVPGKFEELHLQECEQDHNLSRCTLDKFDELTKKYQIESWQKWMQECDNDMNDFNPYEMADL